MLHEDFSDQSTILLLIQEQRPGVRLALFMAFKDMAEMELHQVNLHSFRKELNENLM